MEILKKNITLVIGILIPILMILFVATSIYLPRLFISPHYNFLYASGDYYYNRQQYSVRNGRLVKREIERPKHYNYSPPRVESTLYLYDVAKNESKEISFVEAQSLNLDSSSKSPDGFEVVHGRRGDGFFPFFFWSERDYSDLYLTGHGVSKKINLQMNASPYYNNFRFLGWIK